jgi:NAD(P)-dependent dehydrogenase (short-subunit alcohol dehydrogenase family)
MEASTSPWRGRRVLVTGCTDPLGAAVVGELLAGGAEVVGLVRDRLGAVGLSGRVHVLYGRVEDRFRIYSALAIHEIETVFHLGGADPGAPDQATATVVEAVRLYDRRIPVVSVSVGSHNPVPQVPLGVVHVTAWDQTDSGCTPADAARACLRLAAGLATRPEPHTEEVMVRAGWLAGGNQPGDSTRRAA